MRFGIPKEYAVNAECSEKRVGLSPSGVRELVEAGAGVVVESKAGEASGFLDEAYRKAGAEVVYSHEEAFGRVDVVVKVERPGSENLVFMHPGSVIMAFLHLAAAGKELVGELAERKVTALGYEVIQKEDGTLPILKISSQIAGKIAPQIAGRLLETS